MAPVSRTPTLVITRIATDRAGDTIERLFGTVPDRPLVACSYRGGGAFRGDCQTCIVHVWRKAESLAIKHGIDSPEQTYSQMLLDTYHAAKEAAAAVTAMAGGPADPACRIGLPARVVPGLADLVASACSRTNSGDPANYVLGQTQEMVQLIIRHVRFNRLESRAGVPLYGSVMW